MLFYVKPLGFLQVCFVNSVYFQTVIIGAAMTNLNRIRVVVLGSSKVGKSGKILYTKICILYITE